MHQSRTNQPTHGSSNNVRRFQSGIQLHPPRYGINFADRDTCGKSGDTINIVQQIGGVLGVDAMSVAINTQSSLPGQVAAVAAARGGSELHFAPGMFRPNELVGRELIGEELAHIRQQREGRVQRTGAIDGVAVNEDIALETEAKSAGKRAARSLQMSDLATETGKLDARASEFVQGANVGEYVTTTDTCATMTRASTNAGEPVAQMMKIFGRGNKGEVGTPSAVRRLSPVDIFNDRILNILHGEIDAQIVSELAAAALALNPGTADLRTIIPGVVVNAIVRAGLLSVLLGLGVTTNSVLDAGS